MRVLYLTHYSIMEPLGQSQILPYLIGLANRGYLLSILSFEKAALLQDQDRYGAQSKLLRECGIEWFPRIYRRGSSVQNLIWDIFETSREVSRRCKKSPIDLIHCRAHVPFMMAWYASIFHRKPILFDFRGFLAEEYVDAGLWKPNSPKFKGTKLLERKMAASCSAMIVLTGPMRDYIRNTYRISSEKLFVVPCCVNLERFHPKEPTTPPPPGRPLKVVYSGSTDGRYDLPAMLRFFSQLLEKRPGSHFTILSTGDLGRAQTLVSDAHLPGDAVSILTLPHHRVPEVLSEQDLGLFFLRGDLTLLAASPTKIGEYLASGLVVVAETGIGGLEEILVQEEAGCTATSNQPDSCSAALNEAIRLCDRPDSRLRSVKTAAKYYSLDQGVETYARAYECAARSGDHGFGSSRAL